MKNFVVGVVVIVSVLAVSATPVQAALSLTLSDGDPSHEQVLTDSGSPGSIVAFNTTIGNWWISQLVGVNVNDSGPFPLLELNYGVTANPGNSSVLTITLTETVNKPPGSSIGDMILALGGVEDSGSVTQKGIINGSALGSQTSGATSIHSYSGNRILTFGPLDGDQFIISEQLIFTGTGHNGGDAGLNFIGVAPEPRTAGAGIFAGVCGLGFVVRSAFRARKN